MNKIPTIAIIGGGFCGTTTLIQLIKNADTPVKIYLINSGAPHSKGLAFSSYNKNHVLNVPAAKMSALPDEPDDFINWVKSKPEYSEFNNDELNDRFLPRVVYGLYLDELFKKSLEESDDFVDINIIEDEATDIVPDNTSAKIVFKNNEPVFADKVVLALGNFKPDNPRLKDPGFYTSKKYFQDPWKKEAVENLEGINDILIIGTGLTMVDNVLSLLEKGYNGKVHALSTNGFFPLSHKKRKAYTDILEEIHPPFEISKLYSIFRKHIKIVLSQGITGEAVVDAIRPKTQEIWMSLSLFDKIRFMSHLRHLWGVARHRLPKEIFDRMQELMTNNKLEIIGGRLQSLNEDKADVKVVFKERKSQKVRSLTVQRVINCTGPTTDIEKIDQLLISNLLKRGVITPDEMRLGINALPDGTIIQKDHSISTIFFTIGSTLKGILWESTAVPELRVQAKSLACEILKQLNVRNEMNAPMR